MKLGLIQICFMLCLAWGLNHSTRAEPTDLEGKPVLRDLVVISDVDDTIRISRIRCGLSIISFLKNMAHSQRSFIGMDTLYTMLAAEGATIAYVSSAPRWLRRFPEKFLASAGFPPGELVLRDSLAVSQVDFKFQAITKVMQAHSGKKFILIGDNGESDSAVFAAIAQDEKWKGRIAGIFVRRIYEYPVHASHTTFLTSADLALEMSDRKILGNHRLRIILEQVTNGLQSRFRAVRERTLPNFVQLHPDDYNYFLAWADRSESEKTRAHLQKILQALSRRCRKN